MDLLGNYSSSSDDDDDDSSSASERSKSPPTPIVQKSSLHQLGGLAPAIPSAKKPAAVKGKPVATGATSRRGKKLISLHSVLPPHILEQLTKSEATGNFEDSSDEEEDDDSNQKRLDGPRKDASKAIPASKDTGIANFLSALGSAKTNKVLKVNKTGAPNKKESSGKLGAAFVSVTSTTTTRTRKDGTQSTSTSTTADPRATPTQQGEANTGSPSHYKPLSLSPRTAFHRFPASKVAAAPPVPLAAAPAVPFDNTPRQVVAPNPPPVPTNYSMDTEISSGGGGSSNRSKKRQLQKALRAGNFDQAFSAAGAANVTSLEQAQPTAYVPEPETYAVPTNGVRVAATSMYNPKAGADVPVNAGGVRARGKNQINQLMASAAAFELQQARSKSNTNNHRAGAKRKYGW